MNITINNILDKLDEKKDSSIIKLLSHKRNKMVFFSANAYYMRTPNGGLKVLTGLLPSLHKCFWPKFNYYSILSKTKKDNNSKGKSVSHSYYGKIRGTIVHKQLHDYLFFDKTYFNKIHTSIHPWTKRIIEEIIKKGWIPLISEFDIFDSKANIGTSVDMICYSKKDSKIILIELKTGYKNVFETQHGYMSGCLKKIMPLSFEYCATLQLATAMLLITKNHEIYLNEMEGHVIQINDNEFNFYKISNDFLIDNGKNIYNNLVKSYVSTIKLKKILKKEGKNKRSLNQINKTPIKRVSFK